MFVNLRIAMKVNIELTKNQRQTAYYAKAMQHQVTMYDFKLPSNRRYCYSNNWVDELLIAKSTLSQHVKELKDVGLIQGEVNSLKLKRCINKENWQEVQQPLKQLRDNQKKIATIVRCFANCE